MKSSLSRSKSGLLAIPSQFMTGSAYFSIENRSFCADRISRAGLNLIAVTSELKSA